METGKSIRHRKMGPFSTRPRSDVMAREAERLPAVSVQLVKTPEATRKDWQRPGPVHYASSVH